MLILSRRPDEVVLIGDSISVMVTGIDLARKKVRLGITTPPGVPVWRSEIAPAPEPPPSRRELLRALERQWSAVVLSTHHAVAPGGVADPVATAYARSLDCLRLVRDALSRLPAEGGAS